MGRRRAHEAQQTAPGEGDDLGTGEAPVPAFLEDIPERMQTLEDEVAQLGAGRSCTKFWDHWGKRMDVPDDFFDSTVKANLVVRHLYFMPKEVGFVIEERDLRCTAVEVANPFGDDRAEEGE